MPYRSDNPFYYNSDTVDADHLLSKDSSIMITIYISNKKEPVIELAISFVAGSLTRTITILWTKSAGTPQF